MNKYNRKYNYYSQDDFYTNLYLFCYYLKQNNKKNFINFILLIYVFIL